MNRMAVVTGAGGFIGGHLVNRLLTEGHHVRAVDYKPIDGWWQVYPDALNVSGCDLKSPQAAHMVCAGVDDVYNLAADMGGMGFIANHKAECMLSAQITIHMIIAAHRRNARYFYASSACVYPGYRQDDAAVTALREQDAYPAMPEDGYGWEKLFGERLCANFTEDFDTVTRVARYHNVYGPHGSWKGGREKAPAAICRKVAEAKLLGHDEIEIWGDGEQTRSFMYVDDCVEGTRRLMDSDIADPLNVGSSELVTINQLVDLVEMIAGITLKRRYNHDAPQGVRGRNSDNTLIREHLGWEPATPLIAGLERTYAWVHDQLAG